MTVQLQRDPFARTTLMRALDTNGRECTECGQPGRFNYWTEHDRIHARPRPTHLKPFCGVGCFRQYYS